MKNKTIVLLLLVLVSSMNMQAQSNFSTSPEKPKPGDQLKFSYTPPKNVFSETDEIKCVAYVWGTYEDEYGIGTGNKPRPKEIVLKKNGNSYEGTVPTDELTTMLSFSFTSGDVKWKRVESKSVLTSGKVDQNNNEGYCIQLYNKESKECKYSNYFRGEYLLLVSLNYIGISNPDKAAEYMLRELELYPDSKYYVFGWLGYAMANNPDKLKSIASKEMEKLFAGGLQTERDWWLMSSLSSAMKLREQGSYFYNQSKEKFKNSGGLQNIFALWNKYAAEKDFVKKEEILNESSKIFNALSYDDKSKLAYNDVVPYYFKRQYLQDMVNAGRLEDFKSTLTRFNISLENNPYDFYTTKKFLDTLLVKDNTKDYAEKMALENYSFFTERISKINAGLPLSTTEYDQYYTSADKKNSAASAATIFADLCAQIYYNAGQFKKGLQYARDAQNYMQMLNEPPYDAPDINNRYCLLAEKVMPAKECKAKIEKFVAGGQYKPEMIDILKRIYVKEKKTEIGFDEYVKTLKQANLEEIKKTLLASQLNEAAPRFALNDMEGKPVNIADLKGKTLVVDFWATWCGPCKASFPGMQKLVTAYKNNPDVKFLFVDTWQREKTDEVKLKAVTDFITSSNYSFHVLMDNNSKVVEDFKVSGIPTKFIIDKNGNIRYKVVGAETNEAKLFDEMNTMIESIK